MRENKFQRIVKKTLERQGAFVINIHGNAYQMNGLPDLQVYSPRWTGHLELKVKGRDPDALQEIVIEKLNRAGTFAWVLREDLSVEVWPSRDIYVLDELSLDELASVGRLVESAQD